MFRNMMHILDSFGFSNQIDQSVKEELGNMQSMMSGFPLVSVQREQDQITVLAEMPGVKKEDLNIELDGRELTISGKRNRPIEPMFPMGKWKGGSDFSRIVRLPYKVNQDDIKANYQDGILELKLERSSEDKTKTIKID